VTALALTIVGCSSHAVRIGPVPPATYSVIGPARASACGVLVFGILPINVNDRTQRAYDAALQRSGGNALVDVSVRDRWYYIYIGGMVCTDIQGTAIR
jgi:hypothetical protein